MEVGVVMGRAKGWHKFNYHKLRLCAGSYLEIRVFSHRMYNSTDWKSAFGPELVGLGDS